MTTALWLVALAAAAPIVYDALAWRPTPQRVRVDTRTTETQRGDRRA